ncbi:hypothetical protein [Virgibacillus salexigens]|uniref:Uncharacterized protein n=1 Tax=Virgibacillus massiliensis TaxID=1462526 RepID=A0A024QIU6_9BACI|nr:hypothetical protein [Virgibacillus massiliensis]CDQ41876.1 hypothetical protein BN990_04255 [Virgibacillus massiliensis]
MQDLLQQMIASLSVEDDKFKEKSTPITISPSLPTNTVKYSKLSDGTDIIFLVHPECNVDVKYHQSTFIEVPIPNLVFCFMVRNHRLVAKHVLCYKDRFLRDDSQLYYFPFSNVFSDGSMCYHTNIEIKDLVQLQTFPLTWLSEPFNDHLYYQSNSNFNLPLRELLEKTQGGSFDYTMLKKKSIDFNTWSSKLINY